jgi:hypothetical protein
LNSWRVHLWKTKTLKSKGSLSLPTPALPAYPSQTRIKASCRMGWLAHRSSGSPSRACTLLENRLLALNYFLSPVFPSIDLSWCYLTREEQKHSKG